MALTVTKAKLQTNFEYIPLTQKGEDKPFTVYFDAIKLDDLAELQDAAIRINKDGEYSISINTLNYAVIKEALTGWANISDDKGSIRFKRDDKGATDSSLVLIPGDIRNELATIIVEVSKDLPNAVEYLAELSNLATDTGSDYEDEDKTDDVPEAVVEKEVPKKTKK